MADRNLLLLDTKNSNPISVSEANKWCSVEDAAVENFIKDIEIHKGNPNEQQDKFRSIISGVPSPWARVLLTRKAVLFPKKDLKDTVLDECYKLLKSEWRGLMAAYAIHPDYFKFDEFTLTGRSAEENEGKLSVGYIYGKMLFNEIPLWLHKIDSEDKVKNPAKIQVLYYIKDGKNIPVAATSPYTFLFSSVNYDLGDVSGIPWVRNGKFVDPLECQDFELKDMQMLLSFLNIMGYNIMRNDNDNEDPTKYYFSWIKSVCEANKGYGINTATIRDYISSWSDELGRWKNEIREKIESIGGNSETEIPLTISNKPKGPLSLLLNSEYKFYLYDGALSLTNRNNGKEILSSNIFEKSELLSAWHYTEKYENSAAYYVITKNKEYALPLPLTKEALDCFENYIHSIVEGGKECYIKLEANLIGESYNGDKYVEFELKAWLEKKGEPIPICKKTYKINVIGSGKVFVWPNFFYADWNKYYYYSEFPTNVSGVRMVPCFDTMDYNTLSPEEVSNNIIVKYPLDNVDGNNHRYEIIKSDSPLKYVDIKLLNKGTEENGGVIILKRTKGGNLANLRPATLGIDFGSTNTCAYYKGENDEFPQPISFKNRRLALVGFDSNSGELACKDELLFISNEEPAFGNGQVKSWIHLHDPRYLDDSGAINGISKIADEIIGGVPVNERNIDVKSMDSTEIITNAGTLRYNMKWDSDGKTKQRKIAYMKMLWIQMCADLVEKQYYPKELNWSFPSSMTIEDRRQLKSIYEQVVKYPFKYRPNTINIEEDIKDYTEAESVCAYAISKDTKVNESIMNLGIDVGGSTSDILIMGWKNNKKSLLSQSSVRMAGGFFFNAINSSANFRNALKKFHDSKKTGVKTIKIESIVSDDPQVYSRAPYYLNNIFDQLSSNDDFYEFYNYINNDVPHVFAYPAYVTGVLMFYSGMLVKNAIAENDLKETQEVGMRYYGKGGRLFEWLHDVYHEDATRYYKKCFQAGYGSNELDLKILYQDRDENENKSEVAIGLVSDNFMNIATGELDADKNRIIKRYDIVGEKGIKFVKDNNIVKDLDVISDELFDGGINVVMPDNLENFSTFINVFTKFLKEESILDDVTSLEKGKEKVDVVSFIENDLEFKKCMKLNNSDNRPVYRMPIFIAASLSYLYKILIPIISDKLR